MSTTLHLEYILNVPCGCSREEIENIIVQDMRKNTTHYVHYRTAPSLRRAYPDIHKRICEKLIDDPSTHLRILFCNRIGITGYQKHDTTTHRDVTIVEDCTLLQKLRREYESIRYKA